METTTDRATVGRQMLTEALNDLLLNSRENLPRERNGRPIAPSDPRAAQVRKDIGQGRANPIGQLLTVLECDVRDQVPFSEIVAPLNQLIAHLEVLAVAGRLRASERPIMALMRTETKAQNRADLAQLKLAESPMCAAALAEAIREVEAHERALVDLKKSCVQQLAAVRVSPAPARQVGRGSVAVMR